MKLTLNLKSSSTNPSGQSSSCKIHSEKFFQKASNNEKDFIIFNLSKGKSCLVYLMTNATKPVLVNQGNNLKDKRQVLM